MSAARAVELGGRRQVEDLSLYNPSGAINPFGILEMYSFGRMEPQEYSLRDMQDGLAEAAGFNLRSELTHQLGIARAGIRLYLLDDPRSVASVWLAHPVEPRPADLIYKAVASVTLRRNDDGYPGAIQVGGTDVTGRPFAVYYDFANFSDPGPNGLLNEVASLDVGLTLAEAPQGHTGEHGHTVLIPTPLGFGNMDASGLITKGMIPETVDGMGSSPLYNVAITTGRFDSAISKGTGAGDFSVWHQQPFVGGPADRENFLGPHTFIVAEFTPDEIHAASLRASRLEVVSTLRRA